MNFKLTRNFEMIDGATFGENSNEIIKGISLLEERLKNKDFEYNFFTNARKILEYFLQDEVSEHSTLDAMIREYTDNSIPANVRNALYSIKQKGNNDAHSTKTKERPFVIQIDEFSVIELIKDIWIVTKHFLIWKNVMNADEAENYKFSSKIYYAQIEMDSTADNSAIAIDTESLVSKTTGLFELISSDFNFYIPNYQREYSWKEENINTLLYDIFDRMQDKDMHYTGTLAVSFDSENKLIRLIDGQQRITTSLLLIRAIINRYKKIEKELPEELKDLDLKLVEKYNNKTKEYGDLNCVKKILTSNQKFMTYTPTDKASRAYQNFEIMEAFLNGDDLFDPNKKLAISRVGTSDIDEFLQTFIHNIVVAQLKFKNDVQAEIQIFENMNSKGLTLTSWGLIKNFIFKTISINLLISSDNEIENTINRMFVTPANKSFGTKYEQYLDDFFKVYSQIKYALNEHEALDDKGKIHKVFSKVWPETHEKFKTLDELRNSLGEIQKYFYIYKLIKSEDYLKAESPLAFLKTLIYNMSAKDAHVPLIIQVIFEHSEWSIDNNELIITGINNRDLIYKFINALEIYLVRLMVVSNKSQSLSKLFDSFIYETYDINKVYTSFVRHIQIDGGVMSIPRYKDFVESLREKTDWQIAWATAVLNKLESSKHGEDRLEFVKSPSIEHIFPQKPAPFSAWHNNSGFKEWKTFMSRASEKINMIGNYALVSQSINSSAGRKEFTDKKNEYLRDKGSLIISGGNSVNDNNEQILMNLLQKDDFTLQDIEIRSKQLSILIGPLYKFEWDKTR